LPDAGEHARLNQATPRSPHARASRRL